MEQCEVTRSGIPISMVSRCSLALLLVAASLGCTGRAMNPQYRVNIDAGTASRDELDRAIESAATGVGFADRRDVGIKDYFDRRGEIMVQYERPGDRSFIDASLRRGNPCLVVSVYSQAGGVEARDIGRAFESRLGRALPIRGRELKSDVCAGARMAP